MSKSSEIRLEVARPCSVSWDAMAGDDKVRFCALCQKCVYNVSAMSLREAQTLVAEREGGICVRFYERADGTVMTSDCEIGLARLRSSVRRRWSLVLGAVASVLGLGDLAVDAMQRRYCGVSMGALAAPAVPATHAQAKSSPGSKPVNNLVRN